MTGSLPERTHAYHNHVFNSDHWDHYRPRPDDIIIATSYRSGTTWMQNIVLQLIFWGRPKPPLSDVSPWLDHRTSPLSPKLEKLESQKHRRFLKSHLPLDALPYDPRVKYIVVGRDAREEPAQPFEGVGLQAGEQGIHGPRLSAMACGPPAAGLTVWAVPAC